MSSSSSRLGMRLAAVALACCCCSGVAGAEGGPGAEDDADSLAVAVVSCGLRRWQMECA
jgi:hypothetical protein